MPLSRLQDSSQGSTFFSERALLLLGVIAFVSSLLLWWGGQLNRTAYPQHIAISDNLNQARRSINTAVLNLNRYLAGEKLDRQDVLTYLEVSLLKIRDCLDGRSSLSGIEAIPPSGPSKLYFQSFAEAQARLEHTIRALMSSTSFRVPLRIQLLKELHELNQIGDTLETQLAEDLTQVIASTRREQNGILVIWLIFLVTGFALLYRTARFENSQSQQEQLIYALLDSTSDIIFVKGIDGRYLFCNQAGCYFLGREHEEILGQDDFTLFPEEIAERLAETDQSILQSGTTIQHEEQLPSHQGATHLFLVSKGPLKDRNGKISGLFGISRDITQQRLDEEQLNHHRLMLQRTSRMAKVGGWEIDPCTLEGSCTEECARIHDLAPEKQINLAQGLSFFQGEYRRKIERAVQAAVNQGTPYDLELQMTSAAGIQKWVHTQGEPVMKDGQVIHIYGALQDITTRKLTEEALRTSEQRLKEAQRVAEIGNWQWDMLSDTHTWSDQIYRIYGHSPEGGPIGYPAGKQYFSEESWVALNHAIQLCIQTGKGYTCDAELIRANGVHRWVTIRGEAIPGEDGAVHSLIGTMQDITERKEMEDTLRDSEMRYRALFDQSMDAIAIMEGYPPRMRYINNSFTELFGYDQEEIRAFSGEQIWALVYPEDRALVQEKLKDRMEGRTTSARYEFRVQRKDGKIRWVEVTGSVAKLGLQLINQTIYRDITPRKDAEKAQNTLQEQLNQAQKLESIGRLAGGIAHDFNNMLSIILGGIDLMEEQVSFGTPLAKDLTDIKKAAERSADLTRQLLAFARKQTVAPKVLDLNATVEGLLKMLRRLIGEDIELAWNPGYPLWPVHVDPSQVDQLLANLCINGRDAITEAGTLTIETENAVFDANYCTQHAECVPGEYVLLAVSDNGCGMEREIRKRIFEPFFTTKEVGKGTGLGLATVHGIVHQNKGFIHVYSEPDLGTTFKIYFPRHKTVAQVSQENKKPEDLSASDTTILLVEDEAGLLELNRRMLLGLGYTVLSASTTAEAIRLAHEHADTLDLLLTDVVMPEMNGRDLAQRLTSFIPNLRLVFMSGYTADVIAHHGVLDQGVHFLQKPFSKRELGLKLREALALNP